MGGAGPYVQFDATYRQNSWADRTGLTDLDDAELEDMYRRAHGFLMERKRELVDVHGWTQSEDDDNTLFLLHGKNKQGRGTELRLPSMFASFLDGAQCEMWDRMFQRTWLFDARRLNRNSHTLFIDSLTPASDIFYLLQILAPGMLLIVRVDEYDDVGEEEFSRALPSAEWIQSHESDLREILGSEQRYQLLIVAAGDVSKSFKSDWISNWEPDRDSGMKDFTACSSECGYCGNCDY